MLPEEIPKISNKSVKDLIHFYMHLKHKQHHAIEAPSNKDEPTILIIGAGLSGLTAAKELTTHGLNVILVEARERVGGRIHSVKLPNGAYIELGAQFVHGIKNNPLYSMSEKYHLEVKPYVRSDWGIFDMEGNEINKNDLNALVSEYKDVIKSLNLTRRSDNKDRFTVEDLKELDLKLLKHKAIESGDLHSLAKMITIKELNEEKLFYYKLGLNKKESESNYVVVNGYNKLVEGLHQEAKATGRLQTFLSSEVEKINHAHEEIVVHIKGGEVIHADAAICTLPLGVLQSGSVIFEPLLSESKIKAINTLKNVVHNKVVLEFEEVFWDNYSHFVVLYDPTLEAWLDIINLQYFSELKTPVLVTSVYAGPDKKIAKDKYAINHFVNLLKRMYPDTFRPLRKSWITHWEDDPFAMGSYSYHPEGSTLDDNSAIAKPVGRLVFAGEHTNRSPSNLQAAYLSGFESAAQVVEQLLHIYQAVARK
ncbi:MAG: NAD(P)/FAD-dependent oxidoreductase [Proteobacteria bacterium]|nr:NAD(P)/FAD-dependent oxidoreductase [Pseudomonadota bacterium]